MKEIVHKGGFNVLVDAATKSFEVRALKAAGTNIAHIRTVPQRHCCTPLCPRRSCHYASCPDPDCLLRSWTRRRTLMTSTIASSGSGFSTGARTTVRHPSCTLCPGHTLLLQSRARLCVRSALTVFSRICPPPSYSIVYSVTPPGPTYSLPTAFLWLQMAAS